METVQRYLAEAFPESEGYYETAAAANESSSHYEDDKFLYVGYVPTAIDPDWWFTVCIITGCLAVNLSLPLWIYLGRRLGFHHNGNKINNKRNNKSKAWETPNNLNTNCNQNDECSINNTTTGEDALMKQLDEARSIVSGYSYAPSGGGGSCAGAPPGSVLSGSIAMSRAGTHLGFHHRPHNMHGVSSPGSVFSGTSGFTDAVLGARPKRSGGHRTRRAGRTKRIIVSKSVAMGDIGDNDEQKSELGGRKLDVRMAAEFTKAEIDLLQQRHQAAQQHKYNRLVPTNNNGGSSPVTIASSEIDFGSAVDDSRSDVAPSILSKLDADAISVRDAVDARDAGTVPPGADGKGDFGYSSHGTMKDNGGFSFIYSLWERLLAVVDWDKEMKKYLDLAGHYSIQGILVEILGLVEISLIGHFMGITQANAYIIVEIVTNFTGTITTGFYECVGVLLPQADGARNDMLIGRYMQLGMIFYCLFAIPGAILWSFCTERAILWYGFDEETAVMGQQYLYATLPGFITYGIDAIFYEMLNMVGHCKYATWFTVISSVIHSGTVFCMLYWGVKDLYILGLFETASGIFCLLLNFAIMTYRGWLDDYWEGLFQTNGLRDFRAVRNVFNTAVPLSFAWVLTYGEWEVMTFFARAMGDGGAEVAAWSLMGYLWSAFETLTDGFGDAAEVRVGFRMGSGQVRLAKLASDKAMYVSFTTAVYATGILFILAMYIPAWLTPDPTLQRMVFDIIPLIGFGQILMVWGMVAWAVLGAQGRIRIATFLEFFISWGIGAPVAAIMVYVFNYNLEGIVGAMTISYTIGTNIYLYMLHTSDWEALSAAVVARNAAEGQSYDEFDWDDLPDNIQDAALILGYNQLMWETGDEEPESNEKPWGDLTSAERKAAGLLGYTRRTWDQEDTDTVSSAGEKMPYDRYSFDSLPTAAKQAAKCLGYTKKIWDSDGCTPVSSKEWDELKPDEQAAAQTLGYDAEKWASDKSENSSDLVEQDWASLSQEAKSAAKILGYTKSIWDNDGSIPAESKDWNDLTPKQRAAAKTLGYTQNTWNEDSDHSGTENTPKLNSNSTSQRSLSNMRSEGSVLEQMISVSDPSKLLESINTASSFYSKNSAEAVAVPSVTDISNRISSFFGISIESEQPKEISIDRKIYDDYDWVTLPPKIQAAYKTLGYTEQVWENDGEAPSSHYDWEELSPEQKIAAKYLGYSAETWDDE